MNNKDRLLCMWSCYGESDTAGTQPPSGTPSQLSLVGEIDSLQGFIDCVDAYSTPTAAVTRGDRSAEGLTTTHGSAVVVPPGGLFIFRRHIRPCWTDLCVGGHFRIEQSVHVPQAAAESPDSAGVSACSAVAVRHTQAMPLIMEVLEEMSFARSVAIAGVGARFMPMSSSSSPISASSTASAGTTTPSNAILQITLWTLYCDAATVESLRKDIVAKQSIFSTMSTTPTSTSATGGAGGRSSSAAGSGGYTIRFIHHDTIPKDVLERVPPKTLSLAPLLDHLAGRGISLAELPAVTITTGDADILSSFESASFTTQDIISPPSASHSNRNSSQQTSRNTNIISVSTSQPQQLTAHQHLLAATAGPLTVPVSSTTLSVGGVMPYSVDGSVRFSSSNSIALEGLVPPTPVTDWTTSWSPSMFLAAQQMQHQDSSETGGNPLQAAVAIVGGSSSSTDVTGGSGGSIGSSNSYHHIQTSQPPSTQRQVLLTTLRAADGCTTYQLVSTDGTPPSGTMVRGGASGGVSPGSSVTNDTSVTIPNGSSTTQVFGGSMHTATNSATPSPSGLLTTAPAPASLLYATTVPMQQATATTVTYVQQHPPPQQQHIFSAPHHQQQQQQQQVPHPQPPPPPPPPPQSQQHTSTYYVTTQPHHHTPPQETVLHVLDHPGHPRYLHQPYSVVSAGPPPQQAVVPPPPPPPAHQPPTFATAVVAASRPLYQQTPQQAAPAGVFHTVVGQPGGHPNTLQTFQVAYAAAPHTAHTHIVAQPTPPAPLTGSPNPHTYTIAASAMQPPLPSTAYPVSVRGDGVAPHAGWQLQPPMYQQSTPQYTPQQQGTSALHLAHSTLVARTQHQDPSSYVSPGHGATRVTSATHAAHGGGAPQSTTHQSAHWLPQSHRSAFVFRGFVFPPGLNRKEYRHIVHHTDEGVDVSLLNPGAFPAPEGTPDGEIDAQQYTALLDAAKKSS